MTNTLGESWTGVNLFAERPWDVAYCTVDGYIYITAGRKIYRTTKAFESFEEMTISGSFYDIYDFFRGIAEGPDGTMYAMSKVNSWSKPIGSTTFTKNTAQADLTFSYAYFNGGNQISAWPNYPHIIRHGTFSNGFYAAIHPIAGWPQNPDAGDGLYHLPFERFGAGGYVYEKPVISADGKLVFAYDSAGLGIAKIDFGDTSPISKTVYSRPGVGSYATISKEPGTNTIYVLDEESGTNGFMVKSEDNGDTWSSPKTFAGDDFDLFGSGNMGYILPFEGYHLLINQRYIYRSTDDFDTLEKLYTFPSGDGNDTTLRLIRPDDYTYIAIALTDATDTANMWVSTQEFDRPEPEPYLLIRWRNDGKGEWSNYRKILLGNTGDTEIVKKLRGLGRYRTRQYELVCSANFPMTIALVEEFVRLGQGGDGSGS